jgi:hypothetical protein
MLKPERWQHLLRGYPDQVFPQLLAGIATHGARVGYEGPFLRVHGLNYASAFQISDEITKNIISEVSLDRVREVHTLPQFYTPIQWRHVCLRTSMTELWTVLGNCSV